MVISSFLTPLCHHFSVPPCLSQRGHRRVDPTPGTSFPFSLSTSLPPCLLSPGLASILRFRRPLTAATCAVLQDVGATAVVLGGGYVFVFAFDNLTKRNLIQQNLSRKLVHILSGLIFMLSWPIFSASTEARYFAAFIPLVNCVRLIIHGLSLSSDEALIKSVTREGKPDELLRGPLYYVLVLIICALVFWRDSPIGMISLAMMCGGDGIADIMGRKFGSHKIPYNPRKSWAGSISMFIFGFFISLGLLYYYSKLGYLELDWNKMMLLKVALVSFAATIVESLPITDRLDDNISVPVATMIAAYATFGY